MRTTVRFLVCLLLSGCIQANYKDVSDASEYTGLAGSRFVTSTDLIVHAVTHEMKREKQVHEYVVTNRPGFDGPEVIRRFVLKRGTSIRIKRVLSCTNCLGGSVKYDIEIDPPQTEPSIPVRLRGIMEGIEATQNGRTSLKAEFFTPQ